MKYKYPFLNLQCVNTYALVLVIMPGEFILCILNFKALNRYLRYWELILVGMPLLDL
jgi:hypothetical protein